MSTPTRTAIENLPPYALADPMPLGVERIIRLDQNELGIDPSPSAIEAAAAAVANLNRYPEIDHLCLRQAIAEVHALDPRLVLCGAGSMELMGLLAQVYCEPGVEVIVSQYGYKFFQVHCALAGATVKVAAEPAMRIDVEAIAGAVTDRTRIVFIVDPNNPTGARLEPGALRHLREALPDRVMLVLDSAYGEFVSDPDYDSGFGLVAEGRNLAVLRTFSKAYGLAALRVGWLYGPAEVVGALSAARNPNSVTTTGLVAAEAAVKDRPHLEKVRAEVVALRKAFRNKAASLGLSAPPSSGNFVLIGCQGDIITADALYNGLRSKGILVRPMKSYGLNSYLRVTIGSASDMALLGETLDRLVGQAIDGSN